MNNGIKVLSLFDGISCGMVALERAGINVERYVAYEIDKDAIKVSKKNHPIIEHRGNVIGADFTEYQGFDLVIGGSPCQGFSVAGKKLNFNDPRSKLIFEFARALKEANPRYFLLENTLIKKEYMNVISELLCVDPIKIESNLVSAQNRRRLYWTNIPNVELPKNKGILLKDIVEDDALIDRDKSHSIIASVGRTTYREYFRKYQGQMVFKKSEIENIFGILEEQSPMVLSNENTSIKIKKDQKDIDIVVGGVKKTIDIDTLKKCVRKVTPLECERLQTLPDNYTDCINNTQRYKCIGNGWTVDVIAHIFSFITDKGV